MSLGHERGVGGKEVRVNERPLAARLPRGIVNHPGIIHRLYRSKINPLPLLLYRAQGFRQRLVSMVNHSWDTSMHNYDITPQYSIGICEPVHNRKKKRRSSVAIQENTQLLRGGGDETPLSYQSIRNRFCIWNSMDTDRSRTPAQPVYKTEYKSGKQIVHGDGEHRISVPGKRIEMRWLI